MLTYLAKEKRKGNYEDEVCFHKEKLEGMFIKKDANVSSLNLERFFNLPSNLLSIEFETHFVIAHATNPRFDNDRVLFPPPPPFFIAKILINSRQRRSIADRASLTG